MDWQLVLQAVREIGLPGVILFFLCYALWRSGKWVGQEVIVPIRVRVMVFLDDLTKWNRSLGDRLDSIAADQVKHHAQEEKDTTHTREQLNKIQDDMASLWDRLPMPVISKPKPKSSHELG